MDHINTLFFKKAVIKQIREK